MTEKNRDKRLHGVGKGIVLMLPFTRKNRLRIAVAGVVVGLGSSVIAPNYFIKENTVEASKKVAIISQQHDVAEDDNSLLSMASFNFDLSNLNENINNNVLRNIDNNTVNDFTYNETDHTDTSEAGSDIDASQTPTSDVSEEDPTADAADSENEDVTGPTEEQNDGTEESESETVVEEEPAPKFYTIGVRHSSVVEIQDRLMELGFMEYAEPTEYYGSITSDAVKMFQRQQDLKQDGILGPETYETLLSDNAKHYAAKLGMDGADIKRIQQRLYEMGYLSSADMVTGHFGDVTEAAVKKMQENNGLYADGKVGVQTVELLYSEEAKPNLIVYGEKSDIVLNAQKRLKELGYLTTTPDGTYGNDTLIAVKQFQSRNDLIVDGFLGPSTRAVLESSSAVPNGLMLGDNGDAVKRVQELLNKYGYLSANNMTGYFGEVTEDAVKAFQKNNGLTADGNVGVMTMSKLTSGDANKASSSSSGSGSGSSSNGSGSSSSGSSNNGSSSSNGGSSSSNNNSSSSGNSSNSSGGSSSSNNSSVSELISVAKSKVGKPYVLGAKGPNAVDCSGFVYWCLNQIGVKQSYLTSSGWRNVGKYQRISSLSDVRAGDIIVVKGHVGIAAGNGMVIDASSSEGRIVYRSINSWWSSRFIVAWRIFN